MPCVAVVFRKPKFLSDSIIAMYAGQLVHTDICPIDESNPEHTLVCTCYVGENFTASLSSKKEFSDASHVALAIQTTNEEQDAITSYLYTLTERHVRYNYTDVAAMVLPTSFRTSLMGDVNTEDPNGVSSLFCSQAVVLVLRNCLNHERDITKTLKAVNSRCVLPNTLYYLIYPFSRRISCEALQKGEIEPYKYT
jgi:hypothetical protein